MNGLWGTKDGDRGALTNKDFKHKLLQNFKSTISLPKQNQYQTAIYQKKLLLVLINSK